MARSSVLLLLLLLVTLLHAEDNFILPVEEFLGVEYYEFEGDRYGIFTQLVSWDEANQLCPARKGVLVDYETTGLSQFISRALAESAVSFGSLWIAGKLYKETDAEGDKFHWKWVKSQNLIDVTEAPEYPMKDAPFWVNKPPDTYADGHELCLGADRRLHHEPLIVPVDCNQQRPYICKLDKGGKERPLENLPPVVTNTKTFHVFQASVTWAEALSECRLLGMKLAQLTTREEFTKIGHKMLRIRPVMENAWIGGFFHNGKWTWSSSNEDIKLSSEAPDEPELAPWYRPNDIIMEGCLLADRHVCDHFVFVEAKCDRRRNFICEQVTGVITPKPFVKIEDGYWMSTFTETWKNAISACETCLKGKLLKILAADTMTILPILYKGMAISVGKEIRHIWVSGHLFEKEFMWAENADTKAEPATAISPDTYESSKGVNGILVYCAVDLNLATYLLKYECLNMDRENQKNFFMYGLACDLKQHFICQSPETQLTEMCEKSFNRPGPDSSAKVPSAR